MLPPPPPPTGGRRDAGGGRRLAVRVRRWFIPGRDVAGIVYGTITMGALLAAESPRSESFPDTVGAATLALALVWAAHAYTALIDYRLGGREPHRRGEEESAGPPARASDGPAGAVGDSERGERPAATVPAGRAASGRPRPPPGELRRVLGHELAILKGGAVPLLALLLSWAVGASLATAITATLWTCAGTLMAAELVAGRRAAAGPGAVILHVAAGGSLGLAVIALKVILH